MAEDQKSIEWYRNELKLADKNVKMKRVQLEEFAKTITYLQEEVAGLNSVISQSYSDEELTSMLQLCKDGREKLDAKLEDAGGMIRVLEEAVRRARGRIHSDICSDKWCAAECESAKRLVPDADQA